MIVHAKNQPLPVIRAALAAFSVAMTLVLVTAPTANAGTFVQTEVVNGDSVTGGSNTVSADGCLHTSWFVQATIDYDGRHDVNYWLSTTDICRGEHTLVTGQTYDAVVEIFSLRSARVVATVPLSDGSVLRIDNTFDSFGPAEVGIYRFGERSDGWLFQVVSNGQWKEAVSTGTLSLDFAVITQAQSSYVQIMRCDFC